MGALSCFGSMCLAVAAVEEPVSSSPVSALFPEASNSSALAMGADISNQAMNTCGESWNVCSFSWLVFCCNAGPHRTVEDRELQAFLSISSRSD